MWVFVHLADSDVTSPTCHPHSASVRGLVLKKTTIHHVHCVPNLCRRSLTYFKNLGIEMTSIATLTYETPWQANGLTWGTRTDKPFRFAVGSFIHEYNNAVEIVQQKAGELVCRGTFAHAYPPTKIMFAPASHVGKDLLISTADYLRIWDITDVPEGTGVTESAHTENAETDGSKIDSELRKRETIDSKITMSRVFDFGKPNDFCSPVTACDWNVDNPAIVGCCSIDTTVTIWDIQQEKHTVQLIAHDKDVFDIAFAQGSHTFASCGADGAVRIFDLREMEHCTIVYESPQFTPLRVAWSFTNPACICTFGVNDNEAILLDTRFPGTPVGCLTDGHSSSINSISWASHSSHISTAGEDSVVNIWDLESLLSDVKDGGSKGSPRRMLTYDAPQPVNSVSWSPTDPEYVGISTGKGAQVLHI